MLLPDLSRIVVIAFKLDGSTQLVTSYLTEGLVDPLSLSLIAALRCFDFSFLMDSAFLFSIIFSGSVPSLSALTCALAGRGSRYHNLLQGRILTRTHTYRTRFYYTTRSWYSPILPLEEFNRLDNLATMPEIAATLRLDAIHQWHELNNTQGLTPFSLQLSMMQ